jgi:hypothetical protein
MVQYKGPGDVVYAVHAALFFDLIRFAFMTGDDRGLVTFHLIREGGLRFLDNNALA